MPKKPHADEAGPVTPEQPPLDPFGRFEDDDYRLRAVKSRHETQMAMAKARARADVLKVAIPVVVPLVLGAGVMVCAMAMGVPVPWEKALLLFGGAVGR